MERNTGEWVWHHQFYDYICTNCGKPADDRRGPDKVWEAPSFQFCPHCGAKIKNASANEAEGDKKT